MARQVEMDDGYSGDEDGRFKDVQMEVGVTVAGRRWLDWLLGLLRPTLLTYYYTSTHLHTLR